MKIPGLPTESEINGFLSQYDEPVFIKAIELRDLLMANLPNITEQIDLPAKLIAYCYGQKYEDLICVIIPSKKGIKLGFNRGVDLPDPDKLLEGTGKISRYVQIRTHERINSDALKNLLSNALIMYHQKKNPKK
jgi:hypothetical protein